MADSEFLFGDWLTARLKTIVRGNDLRIATAFWSAGGIAALFGDVDFGKAAILLDVALGGTSPKALEKLGAPDNQGLCHHERLHAKVFLSTEGLIVGSANVSRAALGDGKASAWQLEAGSFHAAGSPAWVQASEWFDELYARSPQVRQAEIDRARVTYRPPPPGGGAPAPRMGSLFDLVAAAPERFAAISFVITDTASSEQEVRAARKAARALNTGLDDAVLSAWPASSTFTGWSRRNIKDWKKTFVEIWIGTRSSSVYGYGGGVFDPRNGSVLGRRRWPAIAEQAKITLPARDAIAGADDRVARLLLGKKKGVIFADGSALAQALAELRAIGADRPVAWTTDPSGEADPQL